MKILALDIGTKTGWALSDGEDFSCGTEVLATAKEITAWRKERLDRRCDPRIERENIAGDYNDDAIDAFFLHKWAKTHIKI